MLQRCKERSDPISDIAKFEATPFSNIACDMVEEGFWLNLVYRGGDSGVGFDSQGIEELFLIGKWLS